MAQLNISLPAEIQNYLQSRVETAGFPGPSEYIADLIEQEKAARIRALEDHLLRAQQSPGIELTDEDFETPDFSETLRRKFLEQHNLVI